MYLISQLFCVFMLEDTMDVTVLWVLAHFHTSRNPVFLLPRWNFTRSWYSGWIFLYLPCYEYRSLHSHPMLWAWTPRLLAQTSSYSEFIILHGTCFSGPLISCLLTCVSLCICVYTCAHTHTHKHILLCPQNSPLRSPRYLPLFQTSWNVKSSGPLEASIQTKLVEVMEFQLNYFKS